MEQHVHTIKLCYFPQQYGHIQKACGEWLLALLTIDTAQELSGKLLVDSGKPVLNNIPCFIPCMMQMVPLGTIHLPLLVCQVMMHTWKG